MSGQHRLFRTRRARQDLIEIWEHGAAENPPAADALLDDIENACSRLIDHPRLVPARDDIRPGWRYLIVGDTVALHRIIDEGIDIVRDDGDEGGALLLYPGGRSGHCVPADRRPSRIGRRRRQPGQQLRLARRRPAALCPRVGDAARLGRKTRARREGARDPRRGTGGAGGWYGCRKHACKAGGEQR